MSDDEIRRLYVVAGRTAHEIADQLHCSVQLVYWRLDRLGVARRPPGPRQRKRPSDDDLKRLYLEEGLSLGEIAGRFEVTKQAVHRWLKAAGVPRRRPGAPDPDVDDEQLVDLYQQRWSGLELAERLGCSASLVYRRLESMSVPRRQPERAVTRPMLVAAVDEGLSAPEMAERFGVSVSTVCKWLEPEALETASQVERRIRIQRYVDLLEEAANHPEADSANIAWLRWRVSGVKFTAP